MRFWNGSVYLENLLAYRLAYIGGHLGSGKTLLGVALCKWLYDNKFIEGVFANIPIDYNWIPCVDHCENAAILLDEASKWADCRKSMFEYSGYGQMARKLNSYWIAPSKNRVDKRMADLVAKRVLDVWALDMWLYKWEDDDEGKGWFLFQGYEEVFGRYDTMFVPSDDGGILDQLQEELKRKEGSTRKILRPQGWGYGRKQVGVVES